MEKLLLNVEEGWRLNKHCCGQEGKELMGCATWLGRRAGAKLVEGIADQLERVRATKTKHAQMYLFTNMSPLRNSIRMHTLFKCQFCVVLGLGPL